MIKELQLNFVPVFPMMNHQEVDFAISKDMKYYGLFWDMGTGKTKTIIDNACHLFLKGEIDGVIVLSDNGCIDNWSKPNGEIEKHVPQNIPFRVASHGSYMLRQERENVEWVMTAQPDMLDFFCVNIEALSRGRAAEIIHRFIQNHYVMFVVDEATSIKTMKSQRSKNVRKLAMLCDYRRAMTGTPVTNSPLDIFGICEFLQPGCLGYNTFVGFKADHATVITVPSGRWHYEIVTGFKNLDKLREKLKKFSSRRLKSECLDLPEKVYETIYIEQTPEQQDAYYKLKHTAVLEFQQGLITSTSAITTIMKLHQINCGHVKLDDKETVIRIPSNRAKTLIETLEKILPEKVVVWCRFREDVELIMEAIKNHKWEKEDYYAIDYYGGTNEKDRSSNQAFFENDENCKWWIGTASTGGKGIDGLQNVCNYQIYYSNSYDKEDRDQSESRLHRKGQKNHVTVIDFEVPGTVDGKIRESHKRKEHLARQVLDDLIELIGVRS